MTFISPNNFFTSFSDFEAAVKGIYGITRGMTGGWQTQLKDLFADYSDVPEFAEQTEDIWRNNPGSDFWAIREGWSVPYEVVSNANQVLTALAGAPLNENQKNSIAAETKFLRAYAYFNLVPVIWRCSVKDETC